MMSEINIPKGGGVYTLKLRGKVIYVGRTQDYNERLLWHSSRRKFDDVDFIKAGRNPHRQESALIKKFNPRDNVQKPTPSEVLRFNADDLNSARLRRIKAEYAKKFAPAKISLQALANLAIELGADKVRMKLNIS